MNNKVIKPSELILNNDGSIYHLHLKPEHIADTVLLVGDQSRVETISRHFDKIEFKIRNREFVTHTGIYKNARITVISTGIGTDNIDIVLNELDAAVNVDLEKRVLKEERKSLNIIRIGTSASLQEDIGVGSFLLSEYGLGLDGLIYYYQYEFSEQEQKLCEKINSHLDWNFNLSRPYVVSASEKWISLLENGMIRGVTATASGFYGPQGRSIYLPIKDSLINEKLTSFQYHDLRITNFEMETSAMFGLGKMMGHFCCTCCGIIANRITNKYADNYKSIINNLVEDVLDKIQSSH
jgi:uridine phosphorylase